MFKRLDRRYGERSEGLEKPVEESRRERPSDGRGESADAAAQ